MEKTIEIELQKSKVETSAKTFEDFGKLIESQVEALDKTLVPLLRVYLDDVRSVRMALAREVKDISLSSQELCNVSKLTKDIMEFCGAVEVLKKVLTPEILEKMERLVK